MSTLSLSPPAPPRKAWGGMTRPMRRGRRVCVRGGGRGYRKVCEWRKKKRDRKGV